MLYIKKVNPNVNVQMDSIHVHAKTFVQPACSFYTFLAWQWCHFNVETSSILIQLFSFFISLECLKEMFCRIFLLSNNKNKNKINNNNTDSHGQ